ncbi:MAG: hypothetical protein WBB98_04495 [Xanthobacteraceae bacterium]
MLTRPMTSNPDLDALIERAVAAYNKMTPQQKREMHEAQRRSWVIDNMLLSNPHLTREYVEEIYDRVV